MIFKSSHFDKKKMLVNISWLKNPPPNILYIVILLLFHHNVDPFEVVFSISNILLLAYTVNTSWHSIPQIRGAEKLRHKIFFLNSIAKVHDLLLSQSAPRLLPSVPHNQSAQISRAGGTWGWWILKSSNNMVHSLRWGCGRRIKRSKSPRSHCIQKDATDYF